MGDFAASFVVDQSPAEVFAAINNVRGWWGEDVEGSTDKLGEEFTYRVQDVHYSKLRIVELVPSEKVVWLVLDNHISFVQDQTEWLNTKISFEIVPQGDKTEVRFVHIGLSDQFECADVCFNAWGFLMGQSLPNLIKTGKGQPYH
jgi:hypothetical protein